MKSTLLLVLSVFSASLFAQPVVSLQQYATGFSSPVDIANAGDDRLFIVEQAGVIRIIDGQGNILPQPFLDIDDRVMGGGEEGLLGLAFHPNYAANRFFFVYYTNNNGDLVISRFARNTSNVNVADTASETIVLTIPHPTNSNHNGGNLEFGPDGFLYIATGDGGGSGDPFDNAQNPQSLLGKMLRINVNTLPYQIPATNPFVDSTNYSEEIWALGLRNPWRFSFDRETGDLWIGDVGQNAWEEIDFQPAGSGGGENYGWKCYEGDSVFGTSTFGCNANFTFPVFAYPNPALGRSVTGGYVYRGCEYPNLYGHYIFADSNSDRVWTLRDSSGTWVATEQLDDAARNYVSFGEDENGELYIAALNGTIYKIAEATPAATPLITAGGPTTFCPGASVMITTPDLFETYAWSNFDTDTAITVTTSGDYSLTAVDTLGCTRVSNTVQVTVHPSVRPTVVSVDDNVLCPGDSVDLSLTGNNSSYLWTTGETSSVITVNVADSFWAVVTDVFGCVLESDTFIVRAQPNPDPEFVHVDRPLFGGNARGCNGVDVQLTTSDTTYVDYDWSNGATTDTITVTADGTFKLTVEDAFGCVGVSDDITVTFFPNPAPPTITQDGFDLFANPDSGYSYSWSYSNPANGEFFVPIASDSNTILFYYHLYSYYVTIRDSNGCQATSDAFIPLIDGIADLWLDAAAVQPNPFNDVILLRYNLPDMTKMRVSLRDLAGKEIALLQDEKMAAGTHTLHISTAEYSLSQGVYFLEVSNGISGKLLKLVKL